MTEKNNSDFPSSSAHVIPYIMSRKTFGDWGFAPETQYISIARGDLGA